MKRKGFTLIELLAVIVVLAIIALIATPIVMNTIKKSKKGAAERSADSFVKQVETAVATERLNGNVMEDGEYEVTSDGNLCKDKSVSCSDENKIKIEMSGTKPTSGKLKITNGVAQISTKLTVGDYDVKYNTESKKYEATEKGNTTPDTPQPTKTYTNGEVVYFNVTTGAKCSSSDYTETQSNTGVNSGCMKFYAFNDDGKDTVNLILDHNTTSAVAWNNTYTDDSGSKINANGPKEVLDQLKNDTKSWVGTETPSNYTMDQSTQSSKAKYTIDYSGYKARLITAQEIATITGNTSFDEKNANSDWYYLDSKTKTASSTCTSGNTTGCSYGWLYDRTSKSCTTYGCLNNSDKVTYGYWTSSSYAANSSNAWVVYFYGYVSNRNVTNSSVYGVRPVITVLKSKLS